MKQIALSYFTGTDLTVIALLIFFVWFTVMAIWVMKVLPKDQVLKMSLLPLQDDFSGEVKNG